VSAAAIAPDMAKALRVAGIVGAAHLIPAENLFRTTRGGEREAEARQQFQWVLHTACDLSLNRVGKVCRRDRSTVSWAVKRVEESLSDPGRAAWLERLAVLAKELVSIGALHDAAVAKLLAREAAR
jgi:hypothetical protein